MSSETPRTINRATLDLIRHFQTLQLQAQLGTDGVWTIGYGHRPNDGTVNKGRTLSEDEALELLMLDLRFFCAGVDRLLLPGPRALINDNQFGALVSLAFSIGLRTLESSTLLRRVNARDWRSAVAEFEKHNHVGGKVLRSLTRRRLSEANLWCGFPNPIVPPSALG